MPPKRKQGKKVYGIAPLLPVGEVLTNFNKKTWKLGKQIAQGGFGRIYTARSCEGGSREMVIKMEAADNGPLFQEIHFYQRTAKPQMLKEYQQQKGWDFLAIPPYIGCGTHCKDRQTYRFLVMQKYGHDLDWCRANTSHPFLPYTVFTLALHCLHALEYMHHHHYVHADIKAENLLQESDSAKDLSRMMLVDFGLARRIPERPQEKEDPKKAHDGTLPLTSVDAHRGCTPSFRGDTEILAYNILLWLNDILPWQNEIKPEVVYEHKRRLKANVKKYLLDNNLASNDCAYLNELVQFIEHSYKLPYDQKPDYQLLEKLLIACKSKCASLKVAIPAKTTTVRKISKRKESVSSADSSPLIVKKKPTKPKETKKQPKPEPKTKKKRPALIISSASPSPPMPSKATTSSSGAKSSMGDSSIVPGTPTPDRSGRRITGYTPIIQQDTRLRERRMKSSNSQNKVAGTSTTKELAVVGAARNLVQKSQKRLNVTVNSKEEATSKQRRQRLKPSTVTTAAQTSPNMW